MPHFLLKSCFLLSLCYEMFIQLFLQLWEGAIFLTRSRVCLLYSLQFKSRQNYSTVNLCNVCNLFLPTNHLESFSSYRQLSLEEKLWGGQVDFQKEFFFLLPTPPKVLKACRKEPCVSKWYLIEPAHSTIKQIFSTYIAIIFFSVASLQVQEQNHGAMSSFNK